MYNLNPQKPIGHKPGQDFVNTDDPYGLKLGIITRVDEVNMKADVKILTGGGDRFEVDITQAMAGPRSFWGGVPEENSLVLLGYRRRHKNLQEAIILGYFSVANRSGLRFDPVSPDDPSVMDEEAADLFGRAVRRKRLKLRPGDVGGMSSDGAEFVLSKDVRMVNRAGDLFELRDAERTLVMQSIHRVDSVAGVYKLSGPTRRGAFWLPEDIFQEGKIPPEFSGLDELQNAGPGVEPGGPYKFVNQDGIPLDVINDANEFPPVTYANGRRYFYAGTMPAANVEDVTVGAEAFTEDRLEMSHTTDMSQEVRDEIDGFQMDRRQVYIERVLGTVVGNDPFTTMGQRQYGRVLKPKIFEDFFQTSKAKFTLEEVDRNPLQRDTDVLTSAGAALFKLVRPNPPDGEFAVSVNKQGKLFMHIPASTTDKYSSGENGVSAEINADGAIKARFGASQPSRVSMHLTLDGGIVAEIGSMASGASVDIRYRGAFQMRYEGTDSDGIAFNESVVGHRQAAVTGNSLEQVNGSKTTSVSGGYIMEADNVNVNSFGGYTGNYGSYNVLVAGKTQYNHALAVLENIVMGGKISTILAGGLVQNVMSGAMTYNVMGGATTFNNAAGAYAVSVGAGAISITTGSGAIAITTGAGAMSLAASGAVSITAGLAMNLSAATLISLASPQVLVGGPSAALGVCRGATMMPPGSPSLDYITGLPLMGSAAFRSLL